MIGKAILWKDDRGLIPIRVTNVTHCMGGRTKPHVEIEATTLSGLEALKLASDFRNEMRCTYGRLGQRPNFIGFDEAKSKIEKVIFNDPATIVLWSDGTKTVVKAQDGETYDKYVGLAMCISKKYLGNKGNYNEVFKKWIPEDTEDDYLKDLYPIEAGTRIRIINAGDGAYGANGKIGVIVSDEKISTSQHGLVDSKPGYYVQTEDDSIWKIAINAKIEILK